MFDLWRMLCSFSRSFYWREIDSEPGGTVPEQLTEEITPIFRAMKGTNHKSPRCIALMGEVGQQVHCRIYELRPSCCSDFGFHQFFGKLHISPENLANCNQARKAFGLHEISIHAKKYCVKRPKLKHLTHHQTGYHPLRKVNHHRF